MNNTRKKEKNYFELRETLYVADPGCLSRILIFTHLGSRISDPKQQKKRGVKIFFFVKPFFVATKLKIILFWNAEENKLNQFSKSYRTFYPKSVTKLSKIWVWDPGFGKNLFRIPDPDPQHCYILLVATLTFWVAFFLTIKCYSYSLPRTCVRKNEANGTSTTMPS